MRLTVALLALPLALFPLLMFWWFDSLSMQVWVGAFCALAALRIGLLSGWTLAKKAAAIATLLVLFGVTTGLQDLLLFKFYPVVVSLVAATFFASTLRSPPSAIERISTRFGVAVTGPAVPYTRRLTMVWLAFFLCNAGIAGYLAVEGSMAAWALYNGAISYLIIFILLLVEYPIRLLYRKHHAR